MSIQKFYTQVQQRDFARQFQFRLVQLANTNFGTEQWPMVYVESATLPGRTINNIPVPFMGLNFNVPGTASYPGSDAYNVIFRCDQNYDIRSTLENATFNTFDDQISSGNYNIARNASVITLDLLKKSNPDSSGAVVRQYQLYGAYVVSVGESQYNIGDNGAIVTVPCTLAYQYWRVTNSFTRHSEPKPAPTADSTTPYHTVGGTNTTQQSTN